MNNFILSLIMLLGISGCNFAAEKPLQKSSLYSLSKNVDQDALIRNCVMITCAEKGETGSPVIGTGCGIGDRFVLTAAHNIAPYQLENEKYRIQCFAVKSVKKNYIVPLSQQYWTNKEGDICRRPNFAACDALYELNITRTHLHPQTRVQKGAYAGEARALGPELIWIKEQMRKSKESAEQLASTGVCFTFEKAGEVYESAIFGPDIAVLECDKPHGLPILEISDPIKQEGSEDKTLVHILGLAGKRYANDDSSQIIGGGLIASKNNQTYQFQPRIIGQRFKCLPADPTNGLNLWVNHPFMKTQGSPPRFLMEAQVFPGAPDGFGLLAFGDSGAGAIIVKDGKPYLVGVVSLGQIEHSFIEFHKFLFDRKFNSNEIRKYSGGLDVLKFYEDSCKTEDRDKKWFITQSLADVTYLKPWIMSVISKSQ